MTEQSIFIIIVGILSFNFLFELVLDILNLKNPSTLPPLLQDIYDQEKYLQSLAYQKVRSNFSFLSDAFSFLLTLALLLLGGFAWISDWVFQYFQNPIAQALVFFAVLGIASDILSLPLQLYSTFVIEEKFGFNKTTVKTFFLDKIKGYFLMALIGGGLGYLFLYLVSLPSYLVCV